MNLKKASLILIGLFSVLLFFSCRQGTSPEKKEFIIPDKNISFYQHIEPMLEYTCGLESGCHSPTDTQSKLLYVELIDKVSLMNHRLSSTGERLVDLSIHQKNPELAPLYLIVKEGYPNSPEDRMPPYWLNRAPLTDNQIEGIKRWIAEGAKD